MSYKSVFKSVAGVVDAAVLSTQVAHAAPQVTDVQMLDQDNLTLEDLIPPQIRPFIGNLDVKFDTGMTFKSGLPASNYANATVTGVECNLIQPFFEQQELQAESEAKQYGLPRSPQELAAVYAVRKLFKDRVLDLHRDDVLFLMGANVIALPKYFTDATSIDVHVACKDYTAPSAPGLK